MHVFISDAHIRTDSSYRARMLMKFLREHRNKLTHLYILGDLFEFWFEYNVVFPKDYFKILAALYNLIQDGKKIHYVLGNHEVMVGKLLSDFGFIIHPRETYLDIDGKRVLLAHGHKIDKRFWNWLWERLLTSRLNHFLYSMIHPDIGVFFAQGIAYLSRKQRRSRNAIQLLEKYARSKLGEVDVVVLAHSHVPMFRQYGSDKYYINTGDWVENFTYGVIDDGRVALKSFI